VKNIRLGSLNGSVRPSIHLMLKAFRGQPKSMGILCSAITVKPRSYGEKMD
jgi:hypothetical protein